ncbi:hypothetical protein TWF788_003524 [Orbilia oligospora]|uniref:Low temperature requirement protein A n=2 Tax=Orbilia oligospora TaxID=2813651 RepID=A0A7C8KC39_ORBOL|nr:hypothetical protein TWF788_003524 [Orbilia oligospora]KAF3205525.1 hypothetical protein TWF679_009285 [Orbilia oligospora]
MTRLWLVYTRVPIMQAPKLIKLPEGRQLHVAKDDDHLLELQESHTDPQFSFTVHGSADHISALHDSKKYHLGLKDALRSKHPEIFEEMEKLQAHMEELSGELHALTQYDVHLEANFGKFGYSANLRTHLPGQKVHEEKKEETSTVIRVWKRPVIRQYFHKGLLWRAKENEEVASFELFVDLLYVGILAVLGDRASEEPSANAFLRFCIAMIPSWKLWNDIGLLVSWFEADDLVQRFIVLFILSCLFGFTTNIFLSETVTYTQMIAFYLAARLFTAVTFIIGALLLPMVKATLYGNSLAILIPSALWIGSIYVEEPNRQALIWIAIFLDFSLPSILVWGMRGIGFIPQKWSDKIKGLFEFYPALNIEHKVERTGAFVSLVFGYSVVALLYQNAAHFGMNAFLGKALLGLLQAYCFNTIYFDIDGSGHELHAIRRKVWSSFLWVNAHLLFVLAFTIGGSGLSKLVLAHESQDTDVHDLFHVYEERSFAHVEDSLRWFYCGGLAVALFSMSLISISHLHKKLYTQKIAKKYRLAYRLLVCIIWLCLPAAHEHLNSLHLISITTGMTISIVALEVYGTSCKGDDMFGIRKPCAAYVCDAEVEGRQEETNGGPAGPTGADPEKGVEKGDYVLRDIYVDVQ